MYSVSSGIGNFLFFQKIVEIVKI